MSERGKGLAGIVVEVDARRVGRDGWVCEVSVVVVVK